jgi:hypothetical protein
MTRDCRRRRPMASCTSEVGRYQLQIRPRGRGNGSATAQQQLPLSRVSRRAAYRGPATAVSGRCRSVHATRVEVQVQLVVEEPAPVGRPIVSATETLPVGPQRVDLDGRLLTPSIDGGQVVVACGPAAGGASSACTIRVRSLPTSACGCALSFPYSLMSSRTDSGRTSKLSSSAIGSNCLSVPKSRPVCSSTLATGIW